MSLSWLKNARFTPSFWWAILTREVGQTDLVFGVRSSSLVGLCTVQCMQDYKSLCAAVTICATLVNIHAHTF